jgi:hypothetical protein
MLIATGPARQNIAAVLAINLRAGMKAVAASTAMNLCQVGGSALQLIKRNITRYVIASAAQFGGPHTGSGSWTLSRDWAASALAAEILIRECSISITLIRLLKTSRRIGNTRHLSALCFGKANSGTFNFSAQTATALRRTQRLGEQRNTFPPPELASLFEAAA